MSPEERQLLSDLFDRVRGQANASRDRDAEALIADAVRAQPYAPYMLAQAVLLQEQALRAADQRIQDLQAQAARLNDELRQAQAQAAPQSSGGFLGGLFGGGASRPAPQPAANPWGQPPQQSGYAPPPAGGNPWGGQPPAGANAAQNPWGAPQQQQPQGGGFLKGALGAAAGVAGGMLLADSIRNLVGGGGHGAESASSLLGGATPATPAASETASNHDSGDKPSDVEQASYDDSGYDFSGADDYGDDI